MQQLNKKNKPSIISSNEQQAIIKFQIKENWIAIIINECFEVIEGYDITPIPEKNQFLKGVINLRGNLIPIINRDILIKNSYENLYDFDKKFKIIVIMLDKELLGLEADDVWKDFINIKDIDDKNNIINVNNKPIKLLKVKQLIDKLKEKNEQ